MSTASQEKVQVVQVAVTKVVDPGIVNAKTGGGRIRPSLFLCSHLLLRFHFLVVNSGG